VKTATGVGIILGISIITALTVNYFSPVGIALVGQWDTSRGVVSGKAKNDVVVDKLEIDDLTTAKALYDNGNVLFVDARSRADYQDGHVKGAISLPVAEFDQNIETLLRQVPPETTLVTYCSGRTCADSHRLAQLLLDSGYQKINVMIDGYPAWEAEGYPIE
jgi:rhodanese-related sulfurtransferase